MTDFDDIARDHGALIRRIARSYEANGARADELVQDIHLALWQALPRFRGEASVRTFVARVAHNRAISHVAPGAGAEGQPAPRSAEGAGGDAEEHVALADLRSKLEAAVQQLPVSLKVAATLALEGSRRGNSRGFGHRHIGCRGAVHRAKERLKEMLKGSAT